MNAAEQLFARSPWIFAVLVWTMPWKGLALWKAAKRGHQRWFIILLLVNTLAILDILYIAIFSRTNKAKNPLPR